MNKEALRMKGKFHVQLFDKNGKLKEEQEFTNLITDVGMNHLLDVGFHNDTQTATWYVGLIDNAAFSAIAATDTAASHSGWAESDDYTEANRVEWTEGAASSRSITNGTALDFSINATVTVNGIFLISDNTKNGTTGILFSAASFAAPISATSGDTLKVTYTISG